MLKRRFALALAVAAFSIAPSMAESQMLGSSIGYTYFFPCQSCTYYNGGTATVGAGVEFANGYGFPGVFTVDITNTQVFVTFQSRVGWSNGAFNGFALNDAGALGDFTSFTLASSTHSAFTQTNLSFDNNTLFVNWQGIHSGSSRDFDVGDQLVMNVSNVTATPEPATMTLLATGMASLIGAARRRRNKA